MSTVQLEIWHLVLLLAMFVSVIATAGRVLLAQIDKRLDTRFEGMEDARESATKHWDQAFRTLISDHKADVEAWRNLERDFFKFRGDLPLEYVRREDFIRNQSVIEAKLDALALHLQNLQIRGLKHD